MSPAASFIAAAPGIDELAGPRVRLRAWRESDRAPFAQLNADPEVMRHFRAPLTRAESDAMIDRMQLRLRAQGWGAWCLEIEGACAGFVGLGPALFPAPFTPAIEIGWRMARHWWGRGYAAEGARLALDYGLVRLRLPEIVSFTTVANARSRALMERIGMRRDPRDDFDHPSLPEGHPVRPHVLYRLKAGAGQPAHAP